MDTCHGKRTTGGPLGFRCLCVLTYNFCIFPFNCQTSLLAIMTLAQVIAVAGTLLPSAFAVNNGLARTPQMGWVCPSGIFG